MLKVIGDPLDDVADSARYGLYTFITASEKPQEFAVLEQCRAHAQAGDLTSALIHYQNQMQEPAYRPVRIGRYWPRR